MPKFGFLLLSVLLFLGSLGALSCGSSNSPRLLQSMTLAPAAADAQNFPNGQVQFTATGSFTAPPTPAQVTVATWCVHDSNGCTAGVGASVDADGVAQCDAGFTGTVTIAALASNGAGAPVVMGGTGALVTGTAQLTCP